MKKISDFQNKLIILVIDKFKKNWVTLLIFLLLGFFLAIMGFNLDKESYISLFSATATIVASLIGFIGIFISYKLQNILDIRKYYIEKVDNLRGKLKTHKVLIIQYEPDKISTIRSLMEKQINILKFKIDKMDENIYLADEIKELQTLEEIDLTLELIQENLTFDTSFSPYKDYFIFAICGIFLFMIPIAFNNISSSNANYQTFFDNWKFVKMPFAGILIGIFFIILKDLAYMLEYFFAKRIA